MTIQLCWNLNWWWFFRVLFHSEMIPLSQVSESFLFKVHTHNAIAGPLEEICIQIAVIYVSSSSTKPLFQTVTCYKPWNMKNLFLLCRIGGWLFTNFIYNILKLSIATSWKETFYFWFKKTSTKLLYILDININTSKYSVK